MIRFDEPVWECAGDDPGCPDHQPTPESTCAGDLECFYTTASSLAYRCRCSDDAWQCDAIIG
jgi:hypothetical protein